MEAIKFAGEEFNSYKDAFECAKELPATFYRDIITVMEQHIRSTLI